MSIEETPTVKHLKEQMRGFGLLLRVNRFLLRLGLGSKRIEDLQAQLDEIDVQLTQHTEYATKFNRYFSEDGWLAHGLFDVSVMQRAVDAYEADGADAANTILLDYYGPDAVARRAFFFNGVEELRERRKFIELALEDYRAERYHAVVPVVLMVIDGATNSAVGKGFHAEGLELDVWDSLTTADGSINRIKSIFQKSRRRTRSEAISLPYRNGILHGMDLGYDNKVVAAKCWCFLFVVADWIKSKKSEGARKEEFEKQTRTPSLRELASSLSNTARLKRAVEEWSPRELDGEYLDRINAGQDPQLGTPERAVLEFVELWKRKNYGAMAESFCNLIAPNPKQYARDVREQLSEIDLYSMQIVQVSDDAPAISVVRGVIHGSEGLRTECEFRLIYESPDGDSIARSLPEGEWRLVWVHPS